MSALTLHVTPAEFVELKLAEAECHGDLEWLYAVSGVVGPPPEEWIGGRLGPIVVVVRKDVPCIPMFSLHVKRWATAEDIANELPSLTTLAQASTAERVRKAIEERQGGRRGDGQ